MKRFHNILITGGAGFIGSHLADRLIEKGYSVKVLDNLEPQVHGSSQKPPSYLHKQVEFVRGDIRERDVLQRVLEGIDAIYHFAASVGVGQSMYQIEKYISVNTLGTARLFDIIINQETSIQKLIMASSMSIYGEGKYNCPNCGVIYPHLRDFQLLKAKQWEHICPSCGKILEPLPTDELKPLYPTSIYAQSKMHQEEMAMLLGQTYGLPVVALRFFNVYGTRQALSNPYTGVCAIFSSRLKNKTPPKIYEDGLQTRDFIHIKDLVTANILALEKQAANYEIFNVGTGVPTSILDIAKFMIQIMRVPVTPQILQQFRKGDIRHCYADITRIKTKLGFDPKIKVQDGLKDLINWVNTLPSVEDKFSVAEFELKKRGLTLD
ncbi:MAG: SDR family NAD(P)-dependent oxidoreductase [Candidatus Helarchaeota archaeon]